MHFDSLELRAVVEQWPLIAPFRITGHTWHSLPTLVVSLEKDGRVGRGEGEGVYYRQDTPERALEEIESLKTTIEAGISRESLQRLLPPGGARNALDCALWDLEAKCTGRPAWQAAGLDRPKPLLTTITCGAGTPEKMASLALGYTQARAIKLKLTGEPVDAERVRAVREARPDVWLGVDANQGFTRSFIEQLMPVLVGARVELIEQPFPIGQGAWVDGLHSPIPLAADESIQGLADIPGLVGRYQVVNIKLDKCGGLTEALAMARAARELGLQAMVGGMMGTSLAMAPAFLVGQLCHVVDLDGPVPLQADRAITVDYTGGFIWCPEKLWGHADETAPEHGRENQSNAFGGRGDL
jgi:L-alanine-DL-glutamate epimerase-like enolase superfamily enzyme